MQFLKVLYVKFCHAALHSVDIATIKRRFLSLTTGKVSHEADGRVLGTFASFLKLGFCH